MKARVRGLLGPYRVKRTKDIWEKCQNTKERFLLT